MLSCMLYLFSVSKTPYSVIHLPLQMCKSLLITHSFKSGELQQSCIQNTQDSGPVDVQYVTLQNFFRKAVVLFFFLHHLVQNLNRMWNAQLTKFFILLIWKENERKHRNKLQDVKT